MQLSDLTKRFIEKAKAEKTNIRKLAKELDIPYDRVYKWFTAKSNPKPPDDAKVQAWLKVEDYSNLPEGDKKTLIELINTIKEKKGWTQGQVSIGAGYESETLAQTLTRGGEGLMAAIKQLQLAYKDILNPNETAISNEMAAMFEVLVERLEGLKMGVAENVVNSRSAAKFSELNNSLIQAVLRRQAEQAAKNEDDVADYYERSLKFAQAFQKANRAGI